MFAIGSSFLGIVAVIVRVVQSTKFNENAGIGSVGASRVELVMVCGLLLLVGLIVLIFGLIKSFREKNARMP